LLAFSSPYLEVFSFQGLGPPTCSDSQLASLF